MGLLKEAGFLEIETKCPVNDLCFSNDTVLIITRTNSNYTYTFADEDNIIFTENCEVE